MNKKYIGMYWFHLAQKKVQLLAPVNMALNLWGP